MTNILELLKPKEEVSQKFLKELLEYNSDSGLITWIRGTHKGFTAGTLDKDGYIIIRVDDRI